MSKTLDPINVTLGASLRQRRQAQRVSLEELGRRIGVTYQQVQKYETGHNRVAVCTAVRIAEALGCTVAELLAPIEPAAARAAPAFPSARAIGLADKIDQLPDEQAAQVAGIVAAIVDATSSHAPRRPARADGGAAVAH